MKKLFLIFFLLFIFLISFSQDNTIDSLKVVLKTLSEDTNKVNLLIKLAIIYEGFSNEEAMKCLDQAKNISKKIDFKYGLATSYYEMGLVYFDKSNYVQAVEYNKKAMELFIILNNKKGLGNTFNGLAGITFKMGDYSNSLVYYEKALQFYKEAGKKNGMGIAYMNIAVLNGYDFEFKEALENNLKALEIFEELNDKNRMQGIYTSIGEIYRCLKNYPLAIEYIKKAYLIKQDFTDKFLIEGVFSTAGSIYFDMDSLELAEANYLKAQDLNIEMDYKEGIATGYLYLGLLNQKKNDFEKSIDYYLKSLKIQKELGIKIQLGSTYNNISNIYFLKKHFPEALKYADFSLQASKISGGKNSILEAYKMISSIYTENKDFEKALKYNNLYISLKDSVFNENSTKQIAYMQTKYETEKKEEQIILLNQKNLLLQQQTEIQNLQLSRNQYLISGLAGFLILGLIIGILFFNQNRLRARQIKSDLEQKFLRSQMNPHFIFNSLMSIQSFAYGHNADETSKYITSFAMLMRLILENSGQEFVLLEKEIATIKYYLELQHLRYSDKFDYSVHVDETIETDYTYIPPMLAQPIIENAIEHGILNKKEGNGFVSVRFSKMENFVEMSIEDNGVGMETAALAKTVQPEKHLSVSTGITRERIKNYNKKSKEKIVYNVFDLKNNKGISNGTKVSIIFPLN